MIFPSQTAPRRYMPAPPPDGAQAGPFPSPTVTADSVDVLNRDTNGISRHAHMVVPDRLIAGGTNAALAPGVVTCAGLRVTASDVAARSDAVTAARSDLG